MRTLNSNTIFRWVRHGLLWCTCLFVITLGPVYGKNAGTIKGTVRAISGEPLPGANVLVQGTNLGSATDVNGEFMINRVSPGSYKVRATFIGYQSQLENVTIQIGQSVTMEFILSRSALRMPETVVSTTRPGETPESESALPADAIDRSPVRVTGELLRELPGVDAVRRGPIGLDPVVRGLRETEVGAYVDGTRTFPAGPARMDSPLSHFDPSAMQRIQVVKGPYALTLGAGNLSAIKVTTQALPPGTDGVLHGSFSGGYYSNQRSPYGALTLQGQHQKLSYWAHSIWRQGSDYQSGNGTVVPAGFLTRETRGKIGYKVTPHSNLTLSAGYQDQENMDYPGRLLNARFFHTRNFSGQWDWQSLTGLIRGISTQIYWNRVEHKMDNTGKPTALPDSTRMPPFALNIQVPSRAEVSGGRIAVHLEPASRWQLTAGGDTYYTWRKADRYIRRADTGMLMFHDLMWPGARIADAGTFLQAKHKFSPIISWSGTVRLDFVQASADTSSQFFRDQISNHLDSRETNLSGATTLSALLSDHWLLSLGLGSAVRTADATERYSDRIPASKAQTSAEFMGDPSLQPERSTQADLWLEGTYSKVSFYVNAFGRRLDNYITLRPTNLPKRLPLSPATVYQYRNGTATFWGFDASLSYDLTSSLSVKMGGQYLWGQDKTLSEPVLGAAPAGGQLSLHYRLPDNRYFIEGTIKHTAAQNRVAITRGETTTSGYTILDLRAGLTVVQGVQVQVGASNLTGVNYTNHLNAKNPFTGEPIPEPGRMIYSKLNYTF